jgi:DNA invertase Pin-like site-specific DNA recombinase
MIIGYAWESPHDQTITVQRVALDKAGCGKIYTHAAGDAKAQREGLEKVLSVLRPGDTFMVCKLDRLGTSVKELVATMTYLSEQGIGFKSLDDRIDTTAKGGTQVFRIFQALHTVMKAKTTAGRRVARAKGRKGGRPTLLTSSQIQELRVLYANEDIAIPEILRKFHVSRPTFYRYVKQRDPKTPRLRGFIRQFTGRR